MCLKKVALLHRHHSADTWCFQHRCGLWSDEFVAASKPIKASFGIWPYAGKCNDIVMK